MNKPEQKYILFYSNQCNHSKEFLQILFKHTELYSKFMKVDVNNVNIKLPKYIQAVPTIIIPGNANGKNNMYVGDEVFKWLDKTLSVVNAKKEAGVAGGGGAGTGGIAEYDPWGMSGFSDGFSYLENPSQASIGDKGFSLAGFGSNQSIQVPDDKDLHDSKLREEKSKRAIEDLMAQRDRDVPMPVSRT